MDPRFRRWTGEGTIAIQLQGGMSVAELFSGYDSRLRFLAPDGFTDTDSSQTIRGPAKRIRAFWRVASDQNKDPLWIRSRETLTGSAACGRECHQEATSPFDSGLGEAIVCRIVEFWRLPKGDMLRHDQRLTGLFVPMFPKR
jgi:hypothetical protein